MTLSLRLTRILTVSVVALTATLAFATNRPDNPNLKKSPDTKLTATLDRGDAEAASARTRSLASAGATVDSRGALVVQTWRDWQNNSSIGRTVDFNPPASLLPGVQFSFMSKLSSATSDRTHWGWVSYEAVTLGGSFVPAGGLDVQCGSSLVPLPPGSCSNMAGSYPKIVVDQSGTAYLGGQEYPDLGLDPNLSQLRVTRDAGPIVGDFGGILDGSVMAESVRDAGGIEGAETFWPVIDISEIGGVTTIYLAAYENAYGNDGAMKVFRKVGWSEANPDNSWELVFVDTSFFPTQDISCDRTSSKVAVAWTKFTPQGRLAGDTSQNDVWYAESTTGASGTWSRTNVTNYTGADYRAWLEVATLYDSQGRLHIVWNGSQTDGLEFGSRRCRIFHWSQWMPTEIRTVYAAEWDPTTTDCTGGSNVMNVGKFSIAECDGRLFVVFSSFNDPATGSVDDCCASAPASSGANGEIFVSVSSQLNGIAWDYPRNISSSYSPGCDTGDCADDRLLGVSRYSMDDALYFSPQWANAFTYAMDGGTPGSKFIQVWYMTDRYPGGGILGTPEGPLTLNDLRWVRLACNPAPNCMLSVSPGQIGEPTYTGTGDQLDTTLFLLNQCTQTLAGLSAHVIEYDGPSGWLATSNVPSSLGAGDTQSVTLRLNNNGVITMQGIYHGAVIFTFGSPVDSTTVPVTLMVADSIIDYWPDSVTTQCGIDLVIYRGMNMGYGFMGGANLDFPPVTVSGPECDTGLNSRGDATIYLGDGSPVIIRKTGTSSYAASWAIFGNGFSDPSSFKWVSGSTAPYGSFTGPGFDGYNSGTYCTSDSLVKVEKTYFAPTGTSNADSCNFIIQRMRIFPYNIGQSVSNLAIGEAFDWDIPSDSGTSNDVGGTDASRRLVYMRGFNSADAVADCYNNSLRYGGASLIKMHMKNCVSDNILFAGYNAPNDSFVYPAGGFVPEQQWNLMKSPGYWNEPRVTDLHSMLVYKNVTSTGWTLPANDTLTIWTAMAVTRPSGGTTAQALDSLRKTVDKASAWSRNVQTDCLSCCVGQVGDLNLDGKRDLSDFSLLLCWILLPHDQCPIPCLVAANLSGTPGVIDLSDVSLFIAYLVNNPRPTLPNCPQ